ncbi:LamG-like jellyroll fold domain-containing protein [Streptomyces sp. NRRL F-5123]|uniref:LamG-like jellyroll fold domain-containing protein n=1 Tax=Streptomyces sp. NRRL F-5123 TaxID=1463856 RepID=UPI00131D01F0|nr:LamG-like jellyroll fold domain-containing protein [Streptomyces sp. NRRL F-5123]
MSRTVSPRRRAVAVAVASALGALSLAAAIPPAQAAPSGSDTSKTALDEAHASAKARETGKKVAVDLATTPTETETANPDGSFTLTQSAQPMRKYADGAWKGLDATLTRNSDGSLSPSLSTTALTLSGGGKGPLAVMKDLSRSLALTLPSSIPALPAPTVSGDSATYAEVLPGVDLKVTADNQGGFSEVLVVKNATAAANPALATLDFTTHAKNVSMATDAAGNITAKDVRGRTVFAAPAPTMWDSADTTAAAPAATTSATTPGEAAARDGRPAKSSTAAPGRSAHVAGIKAHYSDGKIQLTPDASLLTGKSTVFPLYIDPSYSAGGGVLQAWTYVASDYPTTSYWKTTSAAGLRVGYQGWESPYYTGRTFAQMSVDSRIYGAQILSSTFYATETYAPSCTGKPVELWLTGAISSGTTWNAQPSWSSKLDTQTTAHGYNSSCPTASVGWDAKSAVQSAANGSRANITLGLRASDEADPYGWKKFDPSTMTMTTTFDHKPNVPTNLTTSPASTCTSSLKTLGDGDITLSAGVSDTDGGTLSATFDVFKTTGGANITTQTVSSASGHNAVYTLSQANLDKWLGTTAPTGVSWRISSVTDGTYAVGPSKTCSFTFDPTRPGAPTVNDSDGKDCNDSTSTVAYQVSSTATFSVSPNTKGVAPASYLYQLNAGAPISTTGSITLKPTRGTNVLTVTSISSGGNVGDTRTCYVYAAPPTTPAADGDLNGDGTADLTVVGSQADLPPGLWLASGRSSAQVATAATQLGASGTGVKTEGSAADWNSTQAVTGHFNTGSGFNDVVDYNPATGRGFLLNGNGDGSPFATPTSDNSTLLQGAPFTDQYGHLATSIAPGGGLYNTLNGYPATGYPDLLLVINGQLVDEGSNPAAGAFTGPDNAVPISSTNPAGSGDWNGWTLATAQLNGLPALYARDTSSGAVYYYSPTDLENLAYGSTVTPVQVASSGWTSAAAPVLQAADLNGDGTPDLRKVDDAGKVTAYLFNGTTLTGQSGQTLTSGTHNWSLADYTTTTATAADAATSGPLTLTGAGGITANTGDLFDPDIALDQSKSGYLHTTGKALDLTQSFTVSAWVNPTANNTAVLSQNGSADSGMVLSATTGGWQFALNTGAGTAWSFHSVTGGTVQLGAWTHLTATYDKPTGVMNLFVDDVFVATGTHPAPTTGATGNFEIGAEQHDSAGSAYFDGQIAGVQTWSGSVLAPSQPYTPGSYHQSVTPTRVLDTRSASGLTHTQGVTAGTSTVHQGSVTALQIAGDAVSPSASGAPTTIPNSVSAVAIDVTVLNQTGAGFVTTYADGTQRPITSSNNYAANTTVTGYQIVPVGLDGKIDLYTAGSSTDTVALIVDLTGYFTTDAGLTGDQGYTPLTTATRTLDTRSSIANTSGLSGTGTVPGNTTFTLKIQGVGGVPANATAVAVNLTTAGATGAGYLAAYATGTSPAADTALTYDTSSALSSMAADVPVGTGGTITIYNHGSATAVIVDVSGYYTAGAGGQAYHPVNPTRLVDTRNGTGGTSAAPIASMGTYTVSTADTQQVTTATAPTLATVLTVTNTGAAGYVNAYPTGATQPSTSNINFSASDIIANLALTPTSDTDQFSLYNRSSSTLDLIVDCSGYFS